MDLVVICTLEGMLTQFDCDLVLSSVRGIIGGSLHMLNQNRHY